MTIRYTPMSKIDDVTNFRSPSTGTVAFRMVDCSASPPAIKPYDGGGRGDQQPDAHQDLPGSTGAASPSSNAPPAMYRRVSARPTISPAAKPPPGASCPTNST